MAGIFDTMFGGGAEREAADRNRAITAKYGTDAQGYLTSGYETGTQNLDKAVGAYAPLSDIGAKYGKAGDLYLDSLGVNGPEGNARATGAFQTTAGYDIAQRDALEAIARRRSIGGMYNSGNTDQDTADWVTKNLYGTQYAPWQAGLQTAGATGVNATGAAAAGTAAGYGSLANLASTYAGSQAGVAGNVASGDVSASNLQAQGEASGAKNLLGAGLGLATLAAGGAGGLGGIGSSLGNLSSMAKIGNMFQGGGSPSGYG
jgi:hypothetical protein